ncbi:MAG TPA: hypothetical protein VHQ20_00855, partial [Patescibacteria group bacterium]|nr:hypothetical protein [Patescibacteria group bacterium]
MKSLEKYTTWNLKPSIQKVIALLVVWQFISVALMAVGTWPVQVAILNTVLIGIFVLLAKPYYSVLLLILSIPFYVALPIPILPDLPMWRILFAWLFVVWFIRVLFKQRAWLLKVFAVKRWNAKTPITGARLREIVSNSIRVINSRLMVWDKVAGLFLVIAALSLLIAKF